MYKSLSILMFKEDGQWVAQCLQYDLAAQASSLRDLQYEMERTIVGHFLMCQEIGKEPFDCLPPAPKKFWDLWHEAARVELDPIMPL